MEKEMREELEKIKGKYVIIEGYVEKWKKVENRPTYSVLLTHCKVKMREDCYEKGLNKAEYIKIDHLWAYFPEKQFIQDKEINKLERLNTIIYAGIVEKYKRADKTIDYAITAKKTLSAKRLKFLLDRVTGNINYKDSTDLSYRSESLREHLKMFEDKDLTIISDYPVNNVKDTIINLFHKFIENLEINYAYNIYNNYTYNYRYYNLHKQCIESLLYIISINRIQIEKSKSINRVIGINNEKVIRLDNTHKNIRIIPKKINTLDTSILYSLNKERRAQNIQKSELVNTI